MGHSQARLELSVADANGASAAQPLSADAAQDLTRVFEWAMRIAFALSPLVAVAYLDRFAGTGLKFIDYGFHELAIGIACALSAFVAYVTWRCYRHSGEPLLLWVAQGLTGFTAIYLPHGVLTRTVECNPRLFLLYGPASRIVMVAGLLIGLLQYAKPAHDAARRTSLGPFWQGLALFAAIDLGVAALAYSPLAPVPWVRLGMEMSSIALAAAALAILLARGIGSPLMWMYALALMAFAESSFSFMLAMPWDHQWWLGHAIFAAGFFALSYGVLRAFQTTRAFSTVYGQEELMRRLEVAKTDLERLTAHDSLTGVTNRSHFMHCAEGEMARQKRQGAPLSLLMIDLDHPKADSDKRGCPAGDATLAAAVDRMRDVLRPLDLIGRLGTGQFAVLLPESTAAQAAQIAQRIRAAIEQEGIDRSGAGAAVAVSIGVAQSGQDGETLEKLVAAAAEQLFGAKAATP